ncbi:MAG: NlpC/P60 family protein [Nitrospiraceae bacterium]|nr:MAG: NlpC/P60 family protein [Nitrospiraceae bacterium]
MGDSRLPDSVKGYLVFIAVLVLIVPSGKPEIVLAGPHTPDVKAKTDTPAVIQPLENPEHDTPETGHAKPEDFLMYIARQTLGIPYRFGSNSVKATDCSGYVQRVFSIMGIHLPRSAREQFNHGLSVDRENLSAGDLVFFRTYAPFPSHVGIYLGNDLFVHASTIARKVTIDNFATPYYLKRFVGAKRLPGFNELGLSGSMPETAPR